MTSPAAVQDLTTGILSLRPYQVEATTAIEAAWARGLRRPLLHLATGLGKTIVFAELIRRSDHRSLVLVHREELLQQAVDKVRLVAGAGLDVGIVRAEADDHQHRVVVAMVQTLARPNRLERLADDFRLVVVDECHHATAASYSRVLERFSDARLLGVTATPERADGSRLADVWDEIVYSKGLADALREGYLADLRGRRVHLAVNMDAIHTRGGDYVEAEAEEAYLDADAPQYAVEAYRSLAPGRRAIAFTSGVRLAHAFANAFLAAGIPASALDASTPRDERRAILAAFANGDIHVVANCGILTEGFDEPRVDCLIMARPTKSRPLYVQMIGRGTRRHPDKNDCLVIDLVGNSRRHDLLDLGAAFGLDLATGQSLREALEQRDRASQPADDDVLTNDPIAGHLVVETVDLLDSELHWDGAQGLYALPAGSEGTVVLRQEADGWAVWHLAHDGEVRVAAGLQLDYAQGVGEDVVRRLGGRWAALGDASWRMRPASANQLAALAKMGQPVATDLTAGQASDQLSLAIARRAFEPVTERQRYRLQQLGEPIPRELTKWQAQRLLSRLLN